MYTQNGSCSNPGSYSWALLPTHHFPSQLKQCWCWVKPLEEQGRAGEGVRGGECSEKAAVPGKETQRAEGDPKEGPLQRKGGGGLWSVTNEGSQQNKSRLKSPHPASVGHGSCRGDPGCELAQHLSNLGKSKANQTNKTQSGQQKPERNTGFGGKVGRD